MRCSGAEASRKRKSALAGLLALLVSVSAAAATVYRLSVTREGKTFHARAAMHIDATPGAVQAVMRALPGSKNASRYGLVAQLLHWLVALLVTLQFALGINAHGKPVSIERLVLLSRHKSVGLLLLLLVVVRLVWRLHSRPPALPKTLSAPLRAAARVSHGGMYGLLMAMPLVGWASSSAAGLTVSFFGLFPFPNLVAADKELSRAFIAAHIAMAWILLAVVVIHVGAALWHHFVLRDEVLVRMLPRFRAGVRNDFQS